MKELKDLSPDAQGRLVTGACLSLLAWFSLVILIAVCLWIYWHPLAAMGFIAFCLVVLLRAGQLVMRRAQAAKDDSNTKF